MITTNTRNQQSGFLDQTVSFDAMEYPYVVYVPRELSASAPVVLAFHGIGVRGDDGLRQTNRGLARAIRSNPDAWPAIVVMPQAPEQSVWQGSAAAAALAALDQTIAEYEIDEARVYLTGLSMGGNGSWYLAYHHPDRFAALAVVCGFISHRPRVSAFLPDSGDAFAEVAERIKGIPIWAFHGDRDEAIPVDETRKMVAALKQVGAEVRYTEFAGVGHGAWDPAYAMPELSEWLFRQRRRVEETPRQNSTA
jgi:predicted peptidase